MDLPVILIISCIVGGFACRTRFTKNESLHAKKPIDWPGNSKVPLKHYYSMFYCIVIVYRPTPKNKRSEGQISGTPPLRSIDFGELFLGKENCTIFKRKVKFLFECLPLLKKRAIIGN